MAEAFHQVIRSLIGHLEDAGDWEQAIEYARRAVAADPLRETTHQELIRMLAEGGQSSAALGQYRELERLLREELGEEPSPDTRVLVDQRRLLRQKGRGRGR